MLTDVLGKKKQHKNILRLTEEKRNGKRIKWKAGGKWEEEIRVGQKRRGKKKCKRGKKEGKKKKRVIGKKWALPGMISGA